MDSKTYIADAIKTESRDFRKIIDRLDEPAVRFIHAAMGLSTEANEILDVAKKHLFYGKNPDKKHISEEVGDLFWYCAILADTLDLSFEEIMAANIAKLKARYGERFTETSAVTRDLAAEAKAMDDE